MIQQFDQKDARGRKTVIIGDGRDLHDVNDSGRWVGCPRSDACRLDRWE